MQGVLGLVEAANKNKDGRLFTAELLIQEAGSFESAFPSWAGLFGGDENGDDMDEDDEPALVYGHGRARGLKEQVDEFENVLKEFLQSRDKMDESAG
jgi:hypothetical protein